MTEFVSASCQTTSANRRIHRTDGGAPSSLTILLALLFAVTLDSFACADDQPVVFGTDPLNVDVDGQRDLVLHFPWKFRFPDIVRFRDLPQRMLNEPFLQEATVVSEVADDYIQAWIRCFKEETDLEIRIVATEHLSRIARHKNTDLTAIATDLTETLQDTSSRRLKWGCLAVIRDGNLKQTADALTSLTTSADDDVRRVIDPLLSRWQHKPAIDVWTARLQSTKSSNTSRLLTCRALAEMGSVESVEAIGRIVTDSAASFQLRRQAAVAINQLQPATARTLASNLLTGSRLGKLIAISLLNHPHDDATNALYPLCQDPNPAVAVAAWETIETHAAKRLLPLLSQGTQHGESAIRACCTRLAAQFPTLERIQMIHPMLGDQHLVVRNACRQALTSVADEQHDLLQPMIDLMAPQLSHPDTSWQTLEQTCYVLAKLRRPEFAEDLLKLCRHERPEVFVAAAWLFHLMPEPKFKQEFQTLLDERLKMATSGQGKIHPDFPHLDQQIGLLFQAAGYCRFTEQRQHMTDQINKQSGLGERGRSAGIWGIGALNEGSGDKKATKALIDRLQDRTHPLMPELDIVRRMAAQGLGRIGSESAIADLESAFTIDTTVTRIPQTARWALQIMGQPSAGPLPVSIEPVGSWKLLPLNQ